MADNDGIDEALEGAIRLALITAARIGSELVAMRAEQLRQEQARDELAARRAQARHEAERRVAVAELSPVYRRDWWDAAGPEQIGKVYQTATGWAPESPEAAAAAERIQTEVYDRYGIDVPALLHREQQRRAAQVDAAVQAAAREREANPGVPPRGFSYGYFDAQTDARTSGSYTKEEALEVIGRTRPSITVEDVEKNERDWRGPYLSRWFGQDADVDRAIADRLPQLIPARYLETETTASEVAAREEVGRRTEMATEASTDRGAARGGEGARYATVLAEHLGEDSAAAIARAGAWPALVAELHRAEDAGHDVPNLLREITTDYGRDLDDAQDNAAVLQWRAEHQQPKREPEHAAGAAPTVTAERREQIEADALAGIAAAEHAANQGSRWDTPERREAAASLMAGNGLDPEVVAVRMRADTASAAPAAEATAGAGPNSRAPKASVDRGVEAAVEVIAER